MFNWEVFYEPADIDDEPRLIGTITADTMAQALEKAAQYFELPSHDISVKRSKE